MSRLLGLLAYLLVSISIGTTSAAHAMEPQGGMAIAASQATLVAQLGHVQGDADEVPADSDNGVAHHHVSCQGDHAAAPFADGPIIAQPGDDASVNPARLKRLSSTPADPALRPPQA